MRRIYTTAKLIGLVELRLEFNDTLNLLKSVVSNIRLLPVRSGSWAEEDLL